MTYVVAVEGSDGAGKSSVCLAVADLLTSRGIRVGRYAFHDRKFAKKLISNFTKYDCITREMLSSSIWLSALATMSEVTSQGYDVAIFDRFKLTGLMYDHFTGMPKSLSEANSDLLPNPHLLLYLSLAPELALERVLLRSEHVSFFETEYQYSFGADNRKYQQQFADGVIPSEVARQSFLRKKRREESFALEYISLQPQAIVINAAGRLESVVKQCLGAIEATLALHQPL